jgi:hypothetical protein
MKLKKGEDMKKMFVQVITLLLVTLIYAVNYNGGFSSSELQFSTGERGYDTVRINGLDSMGVISAPQLPIKVMSFIIPSGMDVDSISINTSFQTLEGLYNIVPVQPPIIPSED